MLMDKRAEYSGYTPYPGQTPQMEQDRATQRGEEPFDAFSYPETPTRPLETRTYNWAVTPTHAIVGKRDPAELFTELGYIRGDMPHAYGTVEVHARWNATYHIGYSNMSLQQVGAKLKKLTQHQHWNFEGLMDGHGYPYNLSGKDKTATVPGVGPRNPGTRDWEINDEWGGTGAFHDDVPSNFDIRPHDEDDGAIQDHDQFECSACGKISPNADEARLHAQSHNDDSSGPFPVIDPSNPLSPGYDIGIMDQSDMRVVAKLRELYAAEPIIPAPLPAIYDVQQDQIFVGNPGERTSDIKHPGRLTPGGIVELRYDPNGAMSILTSTDQPFTLKRLTTLWYQIHPELPIKSIFLLHGEGKRFKMASAEGLTEEWAQEHFGNILDPVKPTLDDSIWDKAGSPKPVLKPKIKQWIEHTVFSTLDKHGWKNAQEYIDLVITGSLCTYQYSENSDVDVSLWVNEVKLPEWSRADLVSICVHHLDGTNVLDTTHPLQVYAVPHGKKFEDLYQPGIRSGYDLAADKWIIPPDKSTSHDVWAEYPAMIEHARLTVDKLQLLMKYEPDAAKEFFDQVHRKRAEDMRDGKGNFAQSNIDWKLIEHEGLFPAITKLTGEHLGAAGDIDDIINEFFHPEVKSDFSDPTPEEIAQRERERAQRHQEYLDSWSKPDNMLQYAEQVPIETLKRFREYDRAPGEEHAVMSPEEWEHLRDSIAQHGITSPLWLNYHPETKTGLLSEGNHRLKAAQEAGLTHVPVIGYRVSRPSRFSAGKFGEFDPKPENLPKDAWGNPRWPQYIRPSDIGLPVKEVNPRQASVSKGWTK